jgi:uncharacterized delta-60 repeat protein
MSFGMFRAKGFRVGAFASAVFFGAIASIACSDDDEGSGEDGGAGGSTSTGGAKTTGGAKATGGTSASGGAAAGGATATGGTDAGSGGAKDDAGSEDGGGPEGGTTKAPWVAAKTTITPFAGKEDRFYTPVFDANNDVYATGFVNEGGDKKIIVVKYGSDAKVVTSGFGTNGVATINHTAFVGVTDNPNTPTGDPDPVASIEEGRDLALQKDGKIVVAALVEESAAAFTNRQVVVYRLNADGTIDDSFGTNGHTIVDWSPAPVTGTTPNDALWALDVDAEDRILVFGSGKTATPLLVTTDRYVTRLTKNGELDATFNGTGTFSVDTPQGQADVVGTTQPVFLGLNDNARHGFALPNGGAVSAGYTGVAGRNQIVLWKLENDGTRDATFGQDGIVRLAPFANGFAESYGMAVLSNGTVVTTGYGQVDSEAANTNLDLVSVAVTASGALDPSYGVGGALAHDVNGGEDRGRYALALPGDRILFAGGGTQTAGNKDAMFVLLEKNGSPVSNFGTNGHQLYGFDAAAEEFYGAALSKDGKFIVAAGYTSPPTSSLADGNGFIAVLPVGE